jgi:hypothetical protein
MKRIFTCIIAIATAIYALPANAQNERNEGQIKPEARKIDCLEHLPALRNSEIEMRAAVDKPFPDSTITYNLKGEPIRRTKYEYDARGKETSYRVYTFSEGTNNWIETSKRITTYNGFYFSNPHCIN